MDDVGLKQQQCMREIFDGCTKIRQACRDLELFIKALSLIGIKNDLPAITKEIIDGERKIHSGFAGFVHAPIAKIA